MLSLSIFFTFLLIALLVYMATIAPLYNIEQFGEELLISEKAFQKAYPRFFLQKILHNIFLKENYRFVPLLDLILYAHEQGFDAEEAMGWKIFKRNNPMSWDLPHGLLDEKYSPIHSKLCDIAKSKNLSANGYFDFLLPPYQQKFPQLRIWAWEQLKLKKDFVYLAYAASRFEELREEAWDILSRIPDNPDRQWAMFYLVHECPELRLQAWALLKPSIKLILEETKAIINNQMHAPRSVENSARWEALRIHTHLKLSVLKLAQIKEINEEAWQLAVSY